MKNMAVDLRINNNHYLITCGGWCRLRSLLDEDKAAYCKCNAAIKLLIEVSKLLLTTPIQNMTGSVQITKMDITQRILRVRSSN